MQNGRLRAWIALLFLLFPFDGGGFVTFAEENKDFLPPPATISGKEGESLSELLYKRDNTIDEWDAEELKHLQTIKKIFEEPANIPPQPSIVADYRDKTYIGPRDNSHPVTLGQLVSSGVGMLVNHRISEVKEHPQRNKKNKRIIYDNDEVRDAMHLVSSSSSSSSSDDDDNDSDSSFLLFLIALFPALVGLLILVTFVVLLVLEMIRRTRPVLPQPVQYGGYVVDDTEEGAMFEDYPPWVYERQLEPVVRKPLRSVRGKRVVKRDTVVAQPTRSSNLMQRMPGNGRYKKIPRAFFG